MSVPEIPVDGEKQLWLKKIALLHHNVSLSIYSAICMLITVILSFLMEKHPENALSYWIAIIAFFCIGVTFHYKISINRKCVDKIQNDIDIQKEIKKM